MNANEFRQELVQVMPGYRWTVHEATPAGIKRATGTTVVVSSNGIVLFTPTLEVERRENYAASGRPLYSVRFALRADAPFLAASESGTLPEALRGLLDHYQKTAATYQAHAQALDSGRRVSLESSHG